MPEDLKQSDSRDLSDHGLNPKGGIYWNLSPARLYEESFARGDGQRRGAAQYAPRAI